MSSVELSNFNPSTPDDFYKLAARTASFYYHTRLETAIKILSGNEIVFFISPISKMNDENEIILHEKEQNSTYILCFSHIQTESIPMWYLYSGITGEGSRIGFTPARMRDILGSTIEVYPVYQKQMDTSKSLHIDDDYSIEYGWVFYRNKENNSIKYREYKYILHDSLHLFEKGNFLVKDSEWSYEKEFRIVFKLNGVLPDQIALVLNKKKMMADDGLKVTLSPRISESDLEMAKDKMGIPAKYISTSKIKAKMDLLSRNQQSIVEHFPEVVSGLHMDELESIIKQVETELIEQKEKELAHV